MTRWARLGAIGYVVYGSILLLEACWIEAGVHGFPEARYWASLHPSGTRLPIVLGAIWFLTLAYLLWRGIRWAWLVAITWAGLLGGLAVVAILLQLVYGRLELLAFCQEHPFEALAAFASLGSLLGSLVSLSMPEARAYFRDGRPTPTATHKATGAA